MIPWAGWSAEERCLLNPSFCSLLVWHASIGYSRIADDAPLPFEIAFLVLPAVLHRETRNSLPRTVATSLAVWIERNPLARLRVAERARALVPLTRAALLFGGIYGLFNLSNGSIVPNSGWRDRVRGGLGETSDEVRACAKRAEFVGKWFARAGSPSTVMALLGVRP